MRTLPLLFLLLLGIAEGCVVEIRECVLFPNGTQQIGRDWLVVDFTNIYGYEIFDVQIDGIAFIPTVLPGQSVKIDPFKTVEGKEFPLSVKANVESIEDGKRVVYTVENRGEKELNITISIPKFYGFIDCQNCSVAERIVFTANITPNSFANFAIFTSPDFEIPDGEVRFSLEERQNISFGFSIPFSIEKWEQRKWIARFYVSNPTNMKMELNVTGWAEFCTNWPENCTRQDLFTEKLFLNANESFSRKFELESTSVPIFFFKAQGRVEDFCKLHILPATNVTGRYFVGYAILKGFSSKALVTPVAPAPPVFPVVTPVAPQTLPPFTTPPPLSPATIRYSPEIEIPAPVIPKEIAVHYTLAILPALFGVFIASVFVPAAMSRRGLVIPGGLERLQLIMPTKMRIYTIPSNPVVNGIIVEPDHELVSYLVSLGINRESAEAISVAIKVKKPIVARNAEEGKIALA
ncbi:MAG: hypothetical protein QXJ58_03230, partial [Archaeoglobaceae archaeon]